MLGFQIPVIGRHDFYIRAERDLLPPHAPDMLVTRIDQLVTGDFHSQVTQP
jgi:hypothetical protein